MRKRLQIIVGVAALLFFLGQPIVSRAHDVRTDGAITVTLHIDPNDTPVAGDQKTALIFEVTDPAKKFDGDKCACELTITQAGRTIYQTALFQTNQPHSPAIVGVNFVFPLRGSYVVAINGQPRPDASFQSFAIVYPVKVAGAPLKQNLQAIGEIIGAILIVGGAGFWLLRTR